MSFDSAYTWWQARGGETTDIAPPVLIYRLARAAMRCIEGPGLVFALHLALFWSGLALLVGCACASERVRTLALMLLVAFAPVTWLLRGHVWTDVGLFSALLFVDRRARAGARDATARAGSSPRCRRCSTPAAVRHNALPAIVPLAVWIGWLVAGARARACASRSIAARAVRRVVRMRRVDQCAGAAPRAALARHGRVGSRRDFDRERRDAAAAFHDRARPRRRRACRRVPRLEHRADAAEHARTACAIRSWSDYTPEQLADAARARGSTRSARIRARGSRITGGRRVALLGVHDPAWPRELIYVDDEFQYRDNPPIARNDVGAAQGADARGRMAQRNARARGLAVPRDRPSRRAGRVATARASSPASSR